jgi:uncharacterized protein (DUF983 family)
MHSIDKKSPGMTAEYPPLPPARTGMRGLCPRCGKGHLFEGFLTLKPNCDACGLDYAFADPADGPAFFVICFTCVPAVAVACWIEVTYEPPLWVHLFTSFPLLMLACLLPLRPLKGWLVNSQYFYKAEEGKIDRDYVRPAATSATVEQPPVAPLHSTDR